MGARDTSLRCNHLRPAKRPAATSKATAGQKGLRSTSSRRTTPASRQFVGDVVQASDCASFGDGPRPWRDGYPEQEAVQLRPRRVAPLLEGPIGVDGLAQGLHELLSQLSQPREQRDLLGKEFAHRGLDLRPLRFRQGRLRPRQPHRDRSVEVAEVAQPTFDAQVRIACLLQHALALGALTRESPGLRQYAQLLDHGPCELPVEGVYLRALLDPVHVRFEIAIALADLRKIGERAVEGIRGIGDLGCHRGILDGNAAYPVRLRGKARPAWCRQRGECDETEQGIEGTALEVE